MNERTLCDAAQEMRDSINELKDYLNLVNMYGDFEERSFDIWCKTDEIGDILEEIQEYADKMENRLKEYKNAIETLGFERKR